QVLQKKFIDQISSLNFPKISQQSQMFATSYSAPAGYRLPFSGARALSLKIITAAPAYAEIGRTYQLLLPKDAAGEDDVQLVLSNGQYEIHARMEELFPSMSGMLDMRIKMFVERTVNEMLISLKVTAQNVRGLK